VLLPVLLEARQQVLQADRDGATLRVLDLHRRTIEAEQLPHLVGRERERPRLHARDQLVRGLLQRQQDQCPGWHTTLKGRNRSEDGGATFDGDVRFGAAAGSVGRGRLAHETTWLSGGLGGSSPLLKGTLLPPGPRGTSALLAPQRWPRKGSVARPVRRPRRPRQKKRGADASSAHATGQRGNGKQRRSSHGPRCLALAGEPETTRADTARARAQPRGETNVGPKSWRGTAPDTITNGRR